MPWGDGTGPWWAGGNRGWNPWCRGFGRRGFGRGFSGFGWGRRMGTPYYPEEISEESEKSFLEERIQYLEDVLKKLKERLSSANK